MKFESGVHRVQRVPMTESSGKIHTSATVAVLPEAKEIDIEILPNEIRIDTMRASGTEVNMLIQRTLPFALPICLQE